MRRPVKPNLCVTISLLGAALALAACGGKDPTASTSNAFDANEVAANLDRIERVVDSPEWESYRLMAEIADVGPFAVRVAPPARLSVIPLLSPEGRGTTFVYDTLSGGYVPRFSRPGAPDDGVRFILYAVDPLTGWPVASAEIGHADLFDLGTADGPEVALRFIVVSGADIFLDYSVTALVDPTGGSLSVEGLAGVSEERLAFGVEAQSASADASAATNVQFSVEMPEKSFGVRADLATIDEDEGQSGSVDIRVSHRGDTIRVRLDAGAGSAEAEFRVNGELFATSTGGPGGPVIRGADGRRLSSGELRALRGMLRLAGDLTRMFGALVAPAGRLIALAASK
jgi:hypothetical protein